ncbi:MAG TPA: GNAT family N-acetyltransferase [Acidimicrobiales bacterium]|nr:GNAT family N-acetyltransferase [Acidimicrobiales bacterium]
MPYHLAQVNIARLRAALDSEELADFVAALDPVNASADEAVGFVWRLQTEDGNATAVRAFEWDAAGSAGVIVNLSLWESVDALAHLGVRGLAPPSTAAAPTVVPPRRGGDLRSVVGTRGAPANHQGGRTPYSTPSPDRSDPLGLRFPPRLPTARPAPVAKRPEAPALALPCVAGLAARQLPDGLSERRVVPLKEFLAVGAAGEEDCTGMPLPPALPGERLELRRWRESHLDRLLPAVASSLGELRRWMPLAQVMPSANAERAAIRASSDRFERGETFDYFLFERATDALVGAAGVRLPTPGTAELGYWVRSDRHRRGYATEATRVLTSAAFNYLPGIDVVEIHMDKANTASAAVAAKLGYRLDGEEERERLTPGHSGTGLIWSTDRTTWASASSARSG